MNLSNYNTLIFDCDGVVLNSNKVKTRAFYNAALPYGDEAAQVLVDYHVRHGGVSRYKKFEYFLTNIVGKCSTQEQLDGLLHAFAQEVKKGLMICEVAYGLHDLRDMTRNARWLIVSGGDQGELRDVFEKRGLCQLFDGGIFGSPDSKEDILDRETCNQNIQFPAIYFGDSRYDLQAAKKAGSDFVFVREWSEWTDWQDYYRDNEFITMQNINSVIEDSKY
jgi:phosphoglycolate phosphatase-like HAD superfamily hydrolase